jgi:type II secretory pathway component PulJ
MKRGGGFSYMEMLIALGIFALLLMAALPLLNQAGRNLAFAQDGYASHLAAQSLMLSLRESLAKSAPEGTLNSELVRSVAEAYASQVGAESYSVFIWRTGEPPISAHSPCAPEIYATLHGLYSLCPKARVISVLIFNEFGAVAGRAVGVF